MTQEGKKFIDYYKNGQCTIETLQIVYNKGHVTKEEFIEVTKDNLNPNGIEPQEKPPKEENLIDKLILDNINMQMQIDILIENQLGGK